MKTFPPLISSSVSFGGSGGITPPDWVKHHASQSQDRNNKYFILYIELTPFYRNQMYFIVFTAQYHRVNSKSLPYFCLNFKIISPSTTRSPLRFSNRNFMNVSSLPRRYMSPPIHPPVTTQRKLNARHPHVLLMTIKIYKWPPKHNRFIVIYCFRATCFDCNFRVIIRPGAN